MDVEPVSDDEHGQRAGTGSAPDPVTGYAVARRCSPVERDAVERRGQGQPGRARRGARRLRVARAQGRVGAGLIGPGLGAGVRRRRRRARGRRGRSLAGRAERNHGVDVARRRTDAGIHIACRRAARVGHDHRQGRRVSPPQDPVAADRAVRRRRPGQRHAAAGHVAQAQADRRFGDTALRADRRNPLVTAGAAVGQRHDVRAHSPVVRFAHDRDVVPPVRRRGERQPGPQLPALIPPLRPRDDPTGGVMHRLDDRRQQGAVHTRRAQHLDPVGEPRRQLRREPVRVPQLGFDQPAARRLVRGDHPGRVGGPGQITR